jgi:hypothetical protein
MAPKWLQSWMTRFAQSNCITSCLPLYFACGVETTSLDHPLPPPNAHASMSTATASFMSLPPELVLEIRDHLPLDAILALKLTHPRLNETLSLDSLRWQSAPSNCARLAIRTYLSPPAPKPSQLRCILCKANYPSNMFGSSNSPACLPITAVNNAQQTEVIELPPRVCCWHVGRLARVQKTGPGGRNGWISHMDEICMHCGEIQGRARCNCKCDSCSFRTVRTYTRYLNNQHECRRFLFWRDTPSSNRSQGKLWVRETGWDPGKFSSSSTGDRLTSSLRTKS